MYLDSVLMKDQTLSVMFILKFTVFSVGPDDQ